MSIQTKVALFQITERRDGDVFRTERLADTWVELTDAGKSPTRPVYADLLFGTADAFQTRKVDCHHNGLFASSDGPLVGILCGRCDAWIPNENL